MVQPRDGADLRRAALPDGCRSRAALGRRFVDDGPRALHGPAPRGGRRGVGRPRHRAARAGAARHAGPGRLRRGHPARRGHPWRPIPRSNAGRGAPDGDLAPGDAQPPPIRGLRGPPRCPGHGGGRGDLVRPRGGNDRDARARGDGEHRSVHRHARAPGGRAAGERRAGDRDACRGPIRRSPERDASHRAAGLSELADGDRHAGGSHVARRGSLRHAPRVGRLERRGDAAPVREPARRVDLDRRCDRRSGSDLRDVAGAAEQAVTVEERRPATVVPAEGG